MTSPETAGEGGCGQRRHALGRAGCGEREGAHDDPSRELDLEGVVARGLRLGERRLGGATEHRRIRPCAGQNRSASRARHGFRATPPSASRASTIVAFSMRSAAAADTTAKA